MSFDSAIACLPLPCPNQCCPSLGSMPAWCGNMQCWKLGTRLRKDGSCPNKWCSLHRPSLRGENLKGVKKQKKDPAPHMDEAEGLLRKRMRCKTPDSEVRYTKLRLEAATETTAECGQSSQSAGRPSQPAEAPDWPKEPTGVQKIH